MELSILACLLTIFVIIAYRFYSLFLQTREQCCYMLGYKCYKPIDDNRKLDTETCEKIALRNKNLGLEHYRFLLRIMSSSGLGEETYAPENVIAGREEFPTLQDALSEMDGIVFDTLDKLFTSTGYSPSEIDILVVNVSLLSPSPSLTARVINRYKMRDDIKAFNLSGMGCSASLIALDLVQQLFKSYRKQLAVVVSTESLGLNWYCGIDKSMMLSNCLFRSGGCSMLLTNNSELKHRAILKLNHLVRAQLSSSDEAYGCCIQAEDDRGNRGIILTKKLPKIASQALTMNLKALIPKILPIKELLKFLIWRCCRQIKAKRLYLEEEGAGLNLKSGVDHFCIHPGGKAVIDKVGKSLGLSDYDVEPSRISLYRFGNTAAGGVWYVLSYMEAKKRLKKGDNILMISFGSGFKCNTCVWEVMKDLKDVENVWKDFIHDYPPQTLANPFQEKLISDQEHSRFPALC